MAICRMDLASLFLRVRSASMLPARLCIVSFRAARLTGIGLLRCFLGGARNAALLNETDEQIESSVRAELKEILGVTGMPRFVRIHRWRRAMAQYSVGHAARMERIAAAVSGQPGLALAGNAYLGIGVPDCIRSGQQAAATVLSSPASQRYGRFRFQSQM